MALPQNKQELDALLQRMKAAGATAEEKKIVIDGFFSQQAKVEAEQPADTKRMGFFERGRVGAEMASRPGKEITQQEAERLTEGGLEGTVASGAFRRAAGLSSMGERGLRRLTAPFVEGFGSQNKEDRQEFIQEETAAERILPKGFKGTTPEEKLGATVFDIGSTVAGGLAGRAAAAPLTAALPSAGRAANIARTAIPAVTEGLGATTGLAASSKQGLPTPTEIGIGIGADLALGIGGQVLRPIGRALVKQFREPSVENAVKEFFSKAVRPTQRGKQTFKDIGQNIESATDAVGTITELKPQLNLIDMDGIVQKGVLPESVMEFSQAIDQSKEILANEFQRLIRETGEDVAINFDDMLTELNALASDPVVRTIDPKIASEAANTIERYGAQGSFTPVQAQQAIESLNRSLNAFYKNPTPEAYTRTLVDRIVANNLRKNLDETVSNATGEQFQALKNKYGSLKSIEKDVTNRAIVEARRNNVPLVNYADIFTAGDAVRALTTLDPASLTAAGVQKGITSWIRKLNDPNRAVRKMFEEAENALSASAVQSTGQSAFKDIARTGGTTVSFYGKKPKGGFAFSPYKDAEKVIQGKANLTVDDIKQYLKKNKDRINQQNNYFGAWVDESADTVYLDVSTVLEDKEAALNAAKDADQIAVFDLNTFEEITLQ